MEGVEEEGRRWKRDKREASIRSNQEQRRTPKRTEQKKYEWEIDENKRKKKEDEREKKEKNMFV